MARARWIPGPCKGNAAAKAATKDAGKAAVVTATEKPCYPFTTVSAGALPERGEEESG